MLICLDSCPKSSRKPILQDIRPGTVFSFYKDTHEFYLRVGGGFVHLTTGVYHRDEQNPITMNNTDYTLWPNACLKVNP